MLVNGQNEEDTEKHRSLFSVISQDQLFLTGTIRDNLDLFKKNQNSELESILKKVGLKVQLNDKVVERGHGAFAGHAAIDEQSRGVLRTSRFHQGGIAGASAGEVADAQGHGRRPVTSIRRSATSRCAARLH